MASIHEEARETPVVEECDLCVVGGSCTGVFAAVAAARLGLRVVIVEKQGFFGGVATAGLVNVWHSLYDIPHERQIIGGLSVEVIERLRLHGAIAEGISTHTVFNPAELTIELDRVIVEAGVRPRLHTQFVGPARDIDGRLDAVIVEDKNGRQAIRARCFVDATGDADLVARLGLPWAKAEALQPPTTGLAIYGIDQLQEQNPEFKLGEAVFDPQYPEALRLGYLWGAPLPGVPSLRMVFGTRVHGADCSDADELTKAEIEGRRQARNMLSLLRRHFEGGEQIGLANISAAIGIRETRRAKCRHTLTEEEVLDGVRFPDAIANGTYHVDIHHSDGGGLTFRELDGSESINIPGQPRECRRWRPARETNPTFYQIPYRSLVPLAIDNLLIAGRSIGADKGAAGAIRVMINCNQTGEAAGTAACLAVSGDVDVGDVDPAALRALLAKQGAIVI